MINKVYGARNYLPAPNDSINVRFSLLANSNFETPWMYLLTLIPFVNLVLLSSTVKFRDFVYLESANHWKGNSLWFYTWQTMHLHVPWGKPTYSGLKSVVFVPIDTLVTPGTGLILSLCGSGEMLPSSLRTDDELDKLWWSLPFTPSVSLDVE